MLTWATPGICDNVCPMVMSPYSWTADNGNVAERSTTNSTGKSAGFTFRKLGGIVISIGSRRCAIVSAVWTSSAAASMLRLRSNWMVMTLVPCDELNDILAARQPLSDHGCTLGGTVDLHRLHLGYPIPYHEHIIAALAALHRHRRHDHGILGADDELGRDQDPRPQGFALVVHDAAHGHHAGGRIHRILNHRDLAILGLLMAGDRCNHPGFSDRHGLAEIDQHALPNGEGDIDRRHLVDDGERRGIGRTDEIADL